MSDVNEVIQKFLTQEDTQNNLLVLTKDNQAKLDEQDKQLKKLKAERDELTYTGTGAAPKMRAAEDYDTHLTEVENRLFRNKARLEEFCAVL